MQPTKQRTAKGATLLVLVLVTGFLILGICGLFGFEVTRNNAAREELRSASEAAALAGAAALASSDSVSTTTSHDTALTAAQLNFKSNSILGQSLSGAVFLDSRSSSANAVSSPPPTAGEVKMYLEFEDNTGVVQPWNSAQGRVVHVVTGFGEVPAFGQFAGLGVAPVFSSAIGRVPKMDIIMCFDVSGSIDDQTPVTFVKRWWDPAKAKNAGVVTPASAGAIRYDIAKRSDGANATGTLYGILQPGPAGTSVNAEPPENLDQSWGNAAVYPLNWDPSLRQGPGGGADNGTPPGNYPSSAPSANPSDFTDLVVNLDGNNTFAGVPSFSYDPGTGMQTYAFPDVATLVEAARGNLEDATVFKNSGAQASLPDTTIAPIAGYKKAYEALRHTKEQPIGDARVAAQNFFQIMNNNTSATFGFLAFSSGVSTSRTSTLGPVDAHASGYVTGQLSTPFPSDIMGGGSTIPQIVSDIDLTQANGSTDIGDALQEAVNELIANGRQGSTKAIVFFTDGHPTVGPAWNAAATQAKTKNIAIYTVGLAQNTAVVPLECDNLNDKGGKAIPYNDPLTGTAGSYTPPSDGMAATGATGGKFFLVTNRANLRYVFENIARHLVQLGQN